LGPWSVAEIANMSRPDVKPIDDDWTAMARDRSLSAQLQ